MVGMMKIEDLAVATGKRARRSKRCCCFSGMSYVVLCGMKGLGAPADFFGFL
mgnify:CR=1 FL=1|jgi:hypothetical protein